MGRHAALEVKGHALVAAGDSVYKTDCYTLLRLFVTRKPRPVENGGAFVSPWLDRPPYALSLCGSMDASSVTSFDDTYV